MEFGFKQENGLLLFARSHHFVFTVAENRAQRYVQQKTALKLSKIGVNWFRGIKDFDSQNQWPSSHSHPVYWTD